MRARVMDDADPRVALWAVAISVLVALAVYRTAELYWADADTPLVALPALYALAVTGAAIIAYVLRLRADVLEQNELRWLSDGFAIAGIAVLLQAAFVVGGAENGRLATTATGAAGLYLVWHAALGLFTLGAIIAPDRGRARRWLVAVMAVLLAVSITDPAWLPLPRLVDQAGRFTPAYRITIALVVVLLLAVTAAWLVRGGRQQPRVRVWVGAALALATLALLSGAIAPGLFEAAWWSSAALWAAQFVVPAGALFAEQAGLLRLLREHERALFERLDAEIQRAATHGQPVDPHARQRIEAVLRDRAFHPVFQPIYRLDDGELVAVEALTRFDAEPDRPPNIWFDEAATVGLGAELDLAALTAALDASAALPDGVALSINVTPQTLASSELIPLLDRHRDRQLIVEVTEHTVVDDYSELETVLAALRVRGVRLAVDDAGAGFASLRHIVTLGPDIIKLDVSLTRGIRHDPVRRALADCLIRFATETGTDLIAEGIEEPADLETWTELGAHAAQGFLFGRPGPLPVARHADDARAGTDNPIRVEAGEAVAP